MSPLRPLASLFLIALVAAALASCGNKSQESTSTPSQYPQSSDSATMSSSAQASVDSAKNAETAAAAAPAAKSKYDDGPRAADSPVDAALAAQGKTLFTSKGCVTCHAFGKKVIGPDLKGVASQRSAEWMEQQIQHPEVMVKEDPISRDLLAQYKVPMTNQKVTPDQAKALVEYIKQNK